MKRKSWITVLAACLFIALLALLGACGESKPKRYRVTAESGEGYTVSGLAQDGYEEGAQVSFTVTVTDETKEIDAVTSADVAVADKGEGAYGFTMPAKDVTVSVTLKDRSITPPHQISRHGGFRRRIHRRRAHGGGVRGERAGVLLRSRNG